MPGGGQLPLVAFGNQNRVISGNPDMTFFYKVFRRYTHFSQESISIPIDGPNEMTMDAPIRLRAKIPRHADLLTDLAFVFNIPDIYSHIWANPDVSGGTIAHSFRWIHMLGALIIDNIGIFVGGSKVQEFPGEWIALRAQMDLPADKFLKWKQLVGDIPEIHSPEWGIYGRSPSYPYQKGEYPHSVAENKGASASATMPSIHGRQLRVPLPFWFSDAIGKALPLVSLQLHEVEVQITLRTLREVYRIMDTTFEAEPLRYGVNLVYDPSQNTSNNPTEIPIIHDNLTLQNQYEGYTSPYGSLRHFFVDVNLPIPLQDGFIMNAHLEGNYVYLTDRERLMFAERELTSLVHQVQTFKFPGVMTRTKFDIDAHNLVHRIVFFGRRTDAVVGRNDYLNLSNWKYAGQAPYNPSNFPSVSFTSGNIIPYSQHDILRSARILCAGTEIFEEKPAMWFEWQNAFHTTTGSGLIGRPDDVFGPVYQIPFACNASDHDQPSGSLNTSRVREFQIEVDPWPLDPNSQYTYEFTVYIESLNMIKYTNGMGGMAFAV